MTHFDYISKTKQISFQGTLEVSFIFFISRKRNMFVSITLQWRFSISENNGKPTTYSVSLSTESGEILSLRPHLSPLALCCNGAEISRSLAHVLLFQTSLFLFVFFPFIWSTLLLYSSGQLPIFQDSPLSRTKNHSISLSDGSPSTFTYCILTVFHLCIFPTNYELFKTEDYDSYCLTITEYNDHI